MKPSSIIFIGVFYMLGAVGYGWFLSIGAEVLIPVGFHICGVTCVDCLES